MQRRTLRRMILVPVIIFLALLAAAGGLGYYLYSNYMYYQTDDAQVTGNIVSVDAPAAGQLTHLNVKQGDKVTAGQTIATITPAPTTGPNGTPITPAPVDLTSPISGTVLQTSAVQGQNVTPGLNMVQLTDLSNLTITAYVDEQKVNDVNAGQNVDITVDAYHNTTFTGHVKNIVQATAGQFSVLPTEDNASGNFTKVGQRLPVVITLDGNAGKDLVPGMSVEATIHLH